MKGDIGMTCKPIFVVGNLVGCVVGVSYYCLCFALTLLKSSETPITNMVPLPRIPSNRDYSKRHKLTMPVPHADGRTGKSR